MRRKKYQAHRLFTLNNQLAPRISPELAAEIGLIESILLLQIEFWIATEGEEFEGHWWTRKTVREIQDTFIFLSVGGIHRVLDQLGSIGYLVSGQFDHKPGRGAKWWRLEPDQLKKLKSIRLCSPNEQPESSGCSPNDMLNTLNGTSGLISKDQDQIHSVGSTKTKKKLPRIPDSDDEYDDKAERYPITRLKTLQLFEAAGIDLPVVMKGFYPQLDFSKYYKLWWDSRDAKGGIGRKHGDKATLRQYMDNLDNFLMLCVENLKESKSNGQEYRGPTKRIETPAEKRRREDCRRCYGSCEERYLKNPNDVQMAIRVCDHTPPAKDED